MPTNYPLPALLIFIKNPEKGLVMPRLCVDVGEEAALYVYKQLLAHTRMMTQHFPGEKFLFYADYPNWNDAWDTSAYRKRVQQGNDYGERMTAAFEVAFEEGHSQAILIGSNCYELTAAIIQQALEALDNYDMVIGPAQQGGHYLLGMKSLHTELLKNISHGTWGSLTQTVFVSGGMGLTHYVLPTLPEIRTAADVVQSSLQYE